MSLTFSRILPSLVNTGGTDSNHTGHRGARGSLARVGKKSGHGTKKNQTGDKETNSVIAEANEGKRIISALSAETPPVIFWETAEPSREA